MSYTTNMVRKANTLTAKVVVEPRHLEYLGVPGGKGLGIFSPGITPAEDGHGIAEARNTRSRLAYEINIAPGYADAVTANDYRVKRSRFFGFTREFTDTSFEARVKRFFTAVEAGKERLVQRYGSSVPRSQVVQLANEIATQGINVGPCYKVVVHFNRCSTVPFDRSTRGRDGLFHRTDRTKTLWLPEVSEAQLVAMVEYLSRREDAGTDGSTGQDSFVEVTLRRDKLGRFARDNNRRDARSGRIESSIRPPGDPVRASYKPPDPDQVDMG